MGQPAEPGKARGGVGPGNPCCPVWVVCWPVMHVEYSSLCFCELIFTFLSPCRLKRAGPPCLEAISLGRDPVGQRAGLGRSSWALPHPLRVWQPSSCPDGVLLAFIFCFLFPSYLQSSPCDGGGSVHFLELRPGDGLPAPGPRAEVASPGLEGGLGLLLPPLQGQPLWVLVSRATELGAVQGSASTNK